MIALERAAYRRLVAQTHRILSARSPRAALASAATRLAPLVASGRLPAGVVEQTLTCAACQRAVPAPGARAIVRARISSGLN